MANLLNFAQLFLLTLVLISSFELNLAQREFLNVDPSFLSSSDIDSFKTEIRSKLNNLSYLKSTNFHSFFQDIFPPNGSLEFLFEDVNPICAEHSKHALRELTGYFGRLPQLWAGQMLDSWGKFPASGLFSGHVQVPGDFHECLQVRGNFSHQIIKGKFCTTYIVPGPALLNQNASGKSISLADLHPGLRESVDFLTLLEYIMETSAMIMFPMMGTCFPASCSTDEVQLIFSALYANLTNNYLTQAPAACYTDEKPPFDAGDYSMITILSIIAGLCCIGTLFDIIKAPSIGTEKRDKVVVKVLLAFSLKTNTSKWMRIPVGSDNLGCLHGLRFLSLCWVILCHTMLMFSYQYTWNMVDMKQAHKDWSLNVLTNGFYSVDTFLVISGILVAFHLLKELDKRNGKFNYVMFAVHRFLRISPTYIILLGVMATLLPYISSGPGWFQVEIESSNCEVNWWHNILYLNNFLSFAAGKVCYGEAWYLAMDMQFYLLSPLVIYPLWKWRRLGLTFLGALSLMSMLVPGLITYLKELPPAAIPFIDNKTYNNDVYNKPHTRCGPYIAGIFLGYILHLQSKIPGQRKRIPFSAVILGWLLCTVTALALIFAPMSFNDPKNFLVATTSWHAHLYSGTHFFLWGLVINWIVFACVNGHGSWVNSFLSWKIFVPLGRLSFCMYISSYHLQVIYHTTQPHPGHYSKHNLVNAFFGHLVMSALVSFVLTMTLESPFIQLEKILFEPKRKKEVLAGSKENNNNNDVNQSKLVL